MNEHLTATAGAPVADNQNSLTAGPRGPVLVQDYQLVPLATSFSTRVPQNSTSVPRPFRQD